MTSKVMELLESPEMTKICAPMVRYSKQAFRELVRKYGVDIAYTPMIMADSFVRSESARTADFSTSPSDRPLIVQVASHDANEFALAAEMVLPLSDGIDLNCGCPQRWAIQSHLGCWMMTQPEVVADLVATAKRRLPSTFPVSVKIRLHSDLKETVEFVRRMESAKVDFITIHGRTRDERAESPNYDAVKMLNEIVNVPVVHNGGVKDLQEAEDVWRQTGVSGIMVAQGLLNNPAMFAGFPFTPEECVSDYVKTATDYGSQLCHFKHHLSLMVKDLMPKSDRRQINLLNSYAGIVDFLRDRGLLLD